MLSLHLRPAVLAILLCAGAHRAAGAATILLLSGANATPCAPDSHVTFTSASVLTPQSAVVGTGAPADPCAVRNELNSYGSYGHSRCITTTNSSDVSAEFTIHFDLPSGFRVPVLYMYVRADDYCEVWLNGAPEGGSCNNVGVVIETHPFFFRVGTNTLVFKVANSTKCALSSAVARRGPDDAMNLQFEGTVNYETFGRINLGWNDCPSGAAYTQLRTFACDTEEGTNTLVGTWLAPSGIKGCTGNEIMIALQTSGETLSPWWSLRGTAPLGCRPTALTQSGDFTRGPVTCFDYWQGGATGGVIMDDPTYSGNRANIRVLEALQAGDLRITSIPEGTEVYSFKLDIDNTKTVGPGSCGGCTDGACIVLQAIYVTQPVELGPSIRLMDPAVSQYVVWQGWSNADPTRACPDVTPVKHRTWGSIKSLYR